MNEQMINKIEKLEDECAEWRKIAQRRADKMTGYMSELENIAAASPAKWEMSQNDFDVEFRAWAQNRARFALATPEQQTLLREEIR